MPDDWTKAESMSHLQKVKNNSKMKIIEYLEKSYKTVCLRNRLNEYKGKEVGKYQAGLCSSD